MLITALSGPAQDFITKLSNTNRQRCKTTTIGLAKIVADRLQIPSGIPADDARYFETMHLIPVKEILSRVNELVLIDAEEVTNMARAFFKARYSLVNPMETVFSVNSDTAIVDFFGISRYVDSLTLEAIKNSPVEVMETYNGFRAVLTSIADGGQTQ